MGKRFSKLFFVCLLTVGWITVLNSQAQNYALQFDGTSNYVHCGIDSSLDINSGNASGLTVEMWIYRTRTIGPTVSEGLFSRTSVGAEGGYWIGISQDNKLTLDSAQGASGWDEQLSNVTINSGAWHHVAFVVDGSTNKGYIFLDGVDVSATPAATIRMPVTVSTGAYIANDIWDEYAGVIIDDLKVSAVARYTSGFTPPSVPYTSDNDTMGLWHFNENTGTTTDDSSANSNNGILVNTPAWVSGYPFPAGATITVTAPNGGETWQVATQQAVTWTSAGTVGNVNISLSTDGGSNWTALASATSNDGTETITIPNSPSTTCRIRVEDVSGAPSDTSNNNFTISSTPPPQITVTVPNGGESWQANSQQIVTWISQGSVGNVNVDLSTDGGTNWTSLISGTTNDGLEQITVPDSPSTTCKIRVQDVSGTPSDMSNSNFTIEPSIVPPYISVNTTTLDFGEVEIGATKTLAFTITNTGGGLLNGAIVTDKQWIEVQPTSFNGNNVTINVTVDNSVLNRSSGQYTGTISITSNGGNAEVTVVVTATDTSNPAISTSLPSLDFGKVKIGESKTLAFNINNTGGGTLSGTITTTHKWIIVDPTSFLGNSEAIYVTVDNSILSETVGQFSGEVNITSNGGPASVEVTLVATCVLTKPNPYDPTKGNLTFFGDGIVSKDTKIKIYSLSGKLVRTLEEKEGKTEIAWNGKNEEGKPVVNGIYTYTYESPKEKGTGKFTVLRD